MDKKIEEYTFEELCRKIHNYKDAQSSTPTAVVREVLARIDKSYKLIGLMAIGGEGILIAALDSIQTKIAIKIAIPSKKPEVKNVLAYSLFRIKEIKRPLHFEERFVQGCNLQHQLFLKTKDIPSCPLRVPSVRRVSRDPSLFCEMEHIDGPKILDWLKEKNNIAYSLNKFLQLLDAVNFFHNLGVVHRDLKSDNIMIADESRISVVDWTLGKTIGDRNLTIAGVKMGTMPYASPKLIDGDSADATYPDDIFSLGLILYEFAHQASLPRLISEDFTKKEKLQEYLDYLTLRLPDQLQSVFRKATDIIEENRYQTIEPFAAAMRTAIIEMGISEDGRIEIHFDAKPSKSQDEDVVFPAMACDDCICKDWQCCEKMLMALKALKKEGII